MASNDGTAVSSSNMSFGKRPNQKSHSKAVRQATVHENSSKTAAFDQLSARKEVDLRAEEVLDAYCTVMRQNDSKVSLDDEHSVFNLLVKLSQIVA